MPSKTSKSTRKSSTLVIKLYADEARALLKVSETFSKLARWDTPDAAELAALSDACLTYREKYLNYESTDGETGKE